MHRVLVILNGLMTMLVIAFLGLGGRGNLQLETSIAIGGAHISTPP